MRINGNRIIGKKLSIMCQGLSEGQPLSVCCVWLVLCVMSSVVEASL